MKDNSLVRKLEADFTEYYQADLRDLWRPGSGMTVRWVIVHLLELPEESRIKRHYAGEASFFQIRDHLLADIRDAMIGTQYFTAVSAMKELKQSEQGKVLRGYPKRIRRPGEPDQEVKFATREELKMLFPKAALQRRQRHKRS